MGVWKTYYFRYHTTHTREYIGMYFRTESKIHVEFGPVVRYTTWLLLLF
jgi:hypothetical protein